MFDLESIIRPNIKTLEAYSSARDEFSGAGKIFLDANENPYGDLNRYPDPLQKALKMLLSTKKGVMPHQVFVGNGSDEVIDLAFRIFCEPGKDRALTFSPTYGMYEVAAQINQIELIQKPLNHEFQIDSQDLPGFLEDPQLKLILLCSPNNPTGNLMRLEILEYLLNNFEGVLLLDEAYIDFSGQPSLVDRLDEFPNLIISQTFSKARGLAAARLGVAYASEQIISLYNRVKPPYNVSGLNQAAALEELKQEERFVKRKELILKEKEFLYEELSKLKMVEKIYPSDANFWLIKVEDANAIYQALLKKGIIIRNRDRQLKNCLRITVGNPEENRELIKTLKEL